MKFCCMFISWITFVYVCYLMCTWRNVLHYFTCISLYKFKGCGGEQLNQTCTCWRSDATCVRPNTSQRQERWLPLCPLIIAHVPFKWTSRNLKCPQRGALYQGENMYTCLVSILLLNNRPQTTLLNKCMANISVA